MPPLRQLEATATGCDGAGKGPLLVTEQFALQQLGRNGTTVDRHKGATTAGREFVNGTGHDLFAGSGLAED